MKSVKESNMIKTIGRVYLHVSNSGVTFSIVDSGYGPEIQVQTSAFGNLDSRLRIFTNKKSLKKLALLFQQASEYEDYSEEYSCLAK